MDSDATKVIAACACTLGSAGLFEGQNKPFQALKPVDTLVLGCTHYPFAAQHIAALLGPDVTLLDTGVAVALQTRRLLADKLSDQAVQTIEWLSTGQPDALEAAAQAWLGLKADTRTLLI